MLVPQMMKLLFIEENDVATENGNNDKPGDWVVDADINDNAYEDRIIGLCRIFFQNGEE